MSRLQAPKATARIGIRHERKVNELWRPEDDDEGRTSMLSSCEPLGDLEDVAFAVAEVAPQVARARRVSVDLGDRLDPSGDQLPARRPDVLDREADLIPRGVVLWRW